MNTYPCSRCNGTGRIRAFSHVLGGICLKCGGSGKQTSKPAKPSQTWLVSAVERESGERHDVFRIKAKTETAALTIARNTLAKGTGYHPETAQVVPVPR